MCKTIINTILDELERRAERGGREERGRREDKLRGEDGEKRRADKRKSRYSHTWGESLHVVTVTFVLVCYTCWVVVSW